MLVLAVSGPVSAAPDALPFSRESFGLIVLWHLPANPLFARFDFAEAATALRQMKREGLLQRYDQEVLREIRP